MKTLLIKNGTLVTASESYVADLFVKDGSILWISSPLPDEPNGFNPDAVIDATGKYVIPGGIDVHTHLDMPLGNIQSVDDFEAGTIAAACGGTTTIVDYALQSRGETMEHGFETWLKKAEGKAVIDFSFHLTLSEFTEQTLRDMERMTALGVPSFKIFTAYPDRLMLDDASIFRVLKRAKELGALVCAHAENGPVIDVLVKAALAAGHTTPKYHAFTRPPELEGEAVHRLITFADLAGAALYIVHVSSSDALNHIAAAKHRGLPVYAETCPQYLLLSSENYDRILFESAKYVMSPPLRDKPHQEALWQGIQSRTINTIATDHCPFYFNGQKNLGEDDFTRIPNGAPGIETRLSLVYTEGVRTDWISINHFVDLVSTSPAKLFGLYPRKGTLAPGSDADIVIFDPSNETLLSAVTHRSCADYSLYEGMRVKGMPDLVIARGNIIVRDGEFVGKTGSGQFIHRKSYASPD